MDRTKVKQIWTKGEFLFCFIFLWGAAILQGYGLYMEVQEETKALEAFQRLDVYAIEQIKEEGNMTFVGRKAGKITMEDRKDLTDRLFHSLKAHIVEGVREEELYTIYACSPMFNKFVDYGENEINLNLAITYDEKRKESVVYLSIPYLQIDY